MRFYGLSDAGRRRRRNEDSFRTSDYHRAAVLADGMGGHRAGDVASATACDEALARIASSAGGAPRAVVKAAIEAAHAAVLSGAVGGRAGMGCTIVVALFSPGSVCVGHVGDSRAYLVSGKRLRRLTKDHSTLMPGVLSKAVGHEGGDEPDVSEVTLAEGDAVMLCSDGLTGMLDDGEIAAELAPRWRTSAGWMEASARALVAAANAAGGSDNVTVVLAQAGQ